MKRRNGTAMPDTMTRGPRTGQQRAVVPRGPSPIVATAVFLTSLVVVVCVVVAAVLLWRAPRDGNDAAADAQAPGAEAAAEGVGEVADAATSLAAASGDLGAAVVAAQGHATASACNDAAGDGQAIVTLATSALTPDRWIADGAVEPLVGVPFEELAVRCGSVYATEAVTATNVPAAVQGVLEAHVRNGGLRSAVDAAQERDELAAAVPPELLVGEAATSDVAAFALPSGNVVCTIAGGQARCDISAAVYDRSDAPEGCDAGWALAMQVTAGGAQAVCAGERELPQMPAVLGYGESTRAGGFSCAASPQGVACREDATGHGFWLRSEAYLLF